MSSFRYLLPLFALALLAFIACGHDHDQEQIPAYVEHNVGDSEPEKLPPPFTAAQTTALREGFSWTRTTDLAITDAEGRPALYYAVLLLRSREERALLEEMRVVHDALPLFEEELGPWTATTGPAYIDFEGDDAGVFMFAVLPGEVYNELRRSALEGEPIFGAVILRDAPPAYRRAGAILDFERLAANGFSFGLDDSEVEPGGSGSQQKFLARWLRRIVRVARSVSDTIRKAIAFIKPKRDVSLRLAVAEGDPSFRGGGSGFVPLRRAWGPAAGTTIAPHGARVEFRANAALVTARLDNNGYLSTRVPFDSHLVVFLDLQNAAATLTHLTIIERRVRIYSGDGGRGRTADIHIPIETDDRSIHALSVLTDAHDFSREVFGFVPRQAVVMTGYKLGLITRAAAPAFSFFADRPLQALAVLGLPAITDLDIYLAHSTLRERVTLTHEYGHFVMANILATRGLAAFTRVWAPVTWQLVGETIGGDRGGSRLIETRASVEGFADFFATQVVGGVNYYFPLASSSWVVSGGNAACDADLESRSAPCIEDNIGGPPGSFPSMVESEHRLLAGSGSPAVASRSALVTSVLVDAVDGGATSQGLSSGALWSFAGTPRPQAGPHLEDEAVALFGGEIVATFTRWSRSSVGLSRDAFMSALADVANRRHSRLDVCEMFALHDPEGECAGVATSSGPLAASGWELVAPRRLAGAIDIPPGSDTPGLIATWTDLSRTGTAFRATLSVGGGAVLTELLPYARSAGWAPAAPLAFDTEYDLRVITVDGPRESDPAQVRLVSLAQVPTGLALGSTLGCNFEISWQSVGTSFRVVLTDVPGGQETEYSSSSTSFALDRCGTFDIRVYSRNLDGVENPTPSSSLRVVATLCGNGQLDPGEACDDGNLDDGDACSSVCSSNIIIE